MSTGELTPSNSTLASEAPQATPPSLSTLLSFLPSSTTPSFSPLFESLSLKPHLACQWTILRAFLLVAFDSPAGLEALSTNQGATEAVAGLLKGVKWESEEEKEQARKWVEALLDVLGSEHSTNSKGKGKAKVVVPSGLATPMEEDLVHTTTPEAAFDASRVQSLEVSTLDDEKPPSSSSPPNSNSKAMTNGAAPVYQQPSVPPPFTGPSASSANASASSFAPTKVSVSPPAPFLPPPPHPSTIYSQPSTSFGQTPSIAPPITSAPPSAFSSIPPPPTLAPEPIAVPLPTITKPKTKTSARRRSTSSTPRSTPRSSTSSRPQRQKKAPVWKEKDEVDSDVDELEFDELEEGVEEPVREVRLPIGQACMAKYPNYNWWISVILDPKSAPENTQGTRVKGSYLVKSIPTGGDHRWVTPDQIRAFEPAELATILNGNYSTPPPASWKQYRADLIEGCLIVQDPIRLTEWLSTKTPTEEAIEEEREKKRRKLERDRGGIGVMGLGPF